MRAYTPPKKKLTINFDTKGSLAPQTDKYKGYIVLARERTITPAPFTEALGSTMIYRGPREYDGSLARNRSFARDRLEHEPDVQRWQCMEALIAGQHPMKSSICLSQM